MQGEPENQAEAAEGNQRDEGQQEEAELQHEGSGEAEREAHEDVEQDLALFRAEHLPDATDGLADGRGLQGHGGQTEVGYEGECGAEHDHHGQQNKDGTAGNQDD